MSLLNAAISEAIQEIINHISSNTIGTPILLDRLTVFSELAQATSEGPWWLDEYPGSDPDQIGPLDFTL